MSDFTEFQKAVADQFRQMAFNGLYQTDVPGNMTSTRFLLPGDPPGEKGNRPWRT